MSGTGEPRLNRARAASLWSDADLELLKVSLQEGRTIPDIAKMMGRSQEAVRGKAWKGGLLRK